MPLRFTRPSFQTLRSHRWVRRFLWAVLALLVLWLLGWLALPPLVKGPLERMASEKLGRTVTMGALEFTPWTLELTVRNLAIAGQEGAPPQLEVARIYADGELQSLLRLGPVIDALTVDAPHLRVALLADGHYDVDDILARFAKPDDAPPSDPARMALYNLTLGGGQVDIEDRRLGKTHALRDVTVALPFISTLPSQRTITVTPRLSFDLEGSRFSSSAAATPFTETGTGEALIQWSGLDMAPYLAYLPASLPVKVQGAVLDLNLKLAFEQRPEVTLKLRGTAQARKVHITDRQGQPLASWDTLNVDVADVRPLAQVVHIARVAIDGPVLHATRSADGTLNLAQLGAPAPVSAKPALDADASTPVTAKTAKANKATRAPWAISVDDMALRKGRVLWTDASTQPAATLEAQALDVNLRGLAIPFTATAQAAKPFTFNGSFGLQDGNVAFKGQATDQHADVALSLKGLSLAMAQPYLSTFLEPTLTGTLAGELGVKWNGEAAAQIPGATGVQLTAAPLTLSDVALKQNKTGLASLESLTLEGAQLDLDARSVSLDRLALTKPQTTLERAADGRWSFERWQKSARADTEKAVAATANTTVAISPTAPAWEIRVADAVVDSGTLAFTDRMQTRPVALKLTELHVRARNLAPNGNKPEALELSARIATGKEGSKDTPGKLAYQGTLTPQPLAAVGKIDASKLPLHALDGYLADSIAIKLLHADAGFKGDVNFAQNASGTTLRLSGDAAVDDLRANSTAAATEKTAAQVGQQLLAWKNLGLQGLRVALAPGAAPRVEVKETSLSDFFARVTIDETGTINLTRLTQKPGDAASVVKQTAVAGDPSPAAGEPSARENDTTASPAPAAAAQTATADPLAPQLTFGPLSLVNGQVAFSDFFVKPNYSADLSKLTGRLGAFSTQPPGAEPQLAELELRGLAEGSAELEITGKLNPLAKPLALDIAGKVQDLELPPLSPYAVKYAGHGIERGRLSVDVNYKIQPNGQLTARNKLVLNQLSFGEAVKGAPASLPVKLAVALLADSNGVIDLDLPISGSLNDPQFSVGPVIFKAVVNLIGKAITAPFSLLAKALGGSDSLSEVAFPPGQAAITQEARAGLDKLAKALVDRPALKLTVTGTASLNQERKAIQRQRLQDLVLAEKRRQNPGDDTPVAPAEYAKLLQKVYDRTDMPKPRNLVGLAKDLPVPDAEALLLAQLSAPTDDMATDLANQRAAAVKSYLAEQKVPNARLFVAAPKLVDGDAKALPQARLSLTAR